MIQNTKLLIHQNLKIKKFIGLLFLLITCSSCEQFLPSEIIPTKIPETSKTTSVSSPLEKELIGKWKCEYSEGGFRDKSKIQFYENGDFLSDKMYFSGKYYFVTPTNIKMENNDVDNQFTRFEVEISGDKLTLSNIRRSNECTKYETSK